MERYAVRIAIQNILNLATINGFAESKRVNADICANAVAAAKSLA
jgi:hypothetical protein